METATPPKTDCSSGNSSSRCYARFGWTFMHSPLNRSRYRVSAAGYGSAHRLRRGLRRSLASEGVTVCQVIDKSVPSARTTSGPRCTPDNLVNSQWHSNNSHTIARMAVHHQDKVGCRVPESIDAEHQDCVAYAYSSMVISSWQQCRGSSTAALHHHFQLHSISACWYRPGQCAHTTLWGESWGGTKVSATPCGSLACPTSRARDNINGYIVRNGIIEGNTQDDADAAAVLGG